MGGGAGTVGSQGIQARSLACDTSAGLLSRPLRVMRSAVSAAVKAASAAKGARLSKDPSARASRGANVAPCQGRKY